MKKSAKSKKRRFTFKLKAIDAEKVYLAGDFNGWSTSSHPMKHNGDGEWKKQIALPTGKYEYKFLVDGRWMVDPDNDQTCQNVFGTYNSVLSVIV